MGGRGWRLTGGHPGAENLAVWEDWEEFAVTSRAIHWVLFVAALGLPVALVVLAALAVLLAALDDSGGAQFFGRLAVALGGIWAIDLVGLILVGAYRSLSGDEDRLADLERILDPDLGPSDEGLDELGDE